jgi:hypothetical protein
MVTPAAVALKERELHLAIQKEPKGSQPSIPATEGFARVEI